MTDQITISVNDKKIPLSEFPADIITHAIYGMLQSLKGIDHPIKTISIQIKKEE